jgi:hypothetical protein
LVVFCSLQLRRRAVIMVVAVEERAAAVAEAWGWEVAAWTEWAWAEWACAAKPNNLRPAARREFTIFFLSRN